MNTHTDTKKIKKLLLLRRGFVLPFTMLITVLVLFVTTSAMSLLSKQLYFSRLYKQSQSAYYAADDAVSCATAIDDTYVSDDGLGIFPSNPALDATGVDTYIAGVLTYVNTKRAAAVPPLPAIPSLADIKCGQSLIFGATTNFAVSPVNYEHPYINPYTLVPGIEYGKTVSYDMRMDLGAGQYRCAKVTINKTPSFRQIISQGYSNCSGAATAVERAVVNTTISE